MEANQEDREWNPPRAAWIAGMVIVAAALRVAPHPMNFAPIGAIALFSGAYFASKRAAVVVPLFSLLAGDIFTGFHVVMIFVYASFLVYVFLGYWLRRKKTASRIGAATLAGSIQFFLVTNFAMWVTSIGNYPKTLAGLAECYLAGVPLFWNTLAGDVFYVALLFGAMALAETRFPSLREPLGSSAVEE